jgi:hypothetical protein
VLVRILVLPNRFVPSVHPYNAITISWATRESAVVPVPDPVLAEKDSRAARTRREMGWHLFPVSEEKDLPGERSRRVIVCDLCPS